MYINTIMCICIYIYVYTYMVPTGMLQQPDKYVEAASIRIFFDPLAYQPLKLTKL